MVYVLALVGLVAIAVLLYKAIGPEGRSFGPGASSRRSADAPAAHRQPPAIGPDDDLEFLWRLERDARKRDGTDSGPSDPPGN